MQHLWKREAVPNTDSYTSYVMRPPSKIGPSILDVVRGSFHGENGYMAAMDNLMQKCGTCYRIRVTRHSSDIVHRMSPHYQPSEHRSLIVLSALKATMRRYGDALFDELDSLFSNASAENDAAAISSLDIVLDTFDEYCTNPVRIEDSDAMRLDDPLPPKFTFSRVGSSNSRYADRSLLCDDIVIPSYRFNLDETRFRRAFMLSRLNNYQKAYPWESKIAKAVWRGTNTGGGWNMDNYREKGRYRVCTLSLQYPDLIDARLTSLSQANSETKEQLIREGVFNEKGISFPDFMRYRAVIDIDGNSWSDRFVDLLSFNSVVIKQIPEHADFFTEELVPWVHYVPTRHDLSDLVDNIQWINNNVALAQNIIQNANQYWLNRLDEKRITEFWYHTLLEYGKAMLA